MNVTQPELAVVGAALALFGLVAPALDVRGARRRALSDPTDHPTDLTDPTDPSDPTDSPTDPTDPPAEPTEPRAWPAASGPDTSFRLADLRDAGALARPLAAPGLACDAAARAVIAPARAALEDTVLEAPLQPLAYTIAGLETAAGRRRVVVLLFAELWPEGAHAARARALFDLDALGRIAAAVVEPA